MYAFHLSSYGGRHSYFRLLTWPSHKGKDFLVNNNIESHKSSKYVSNYTNMVLGYRLLKMGLG